MSTHTGTHSELSSSDSTFPTDVYDVVVVGAGPVGLATAIGLRQRGLDHILVIDQTRSFRPVGQVIDLLPNGLKALKALDHTAYEAVKTAAIKIPPSQTQREPSQTPPSPPVKVSRQWVQRNLQGQMIDSVSLEYDDWVKEHGEGRLSISWYELQTILRNQLPAGQVKANHRCVDVVDEPGCGYVRVDCISDVGTAANPYAYWVDAPQQEDISQESPTRVPASNQTSIRAKLVVAADGINSQIRKILYRNSPYEAFAEPEYSGFAAVGCLGIQNVPTELLTDLRETFLGQSPVVTIIHDEAAKQPAARQDLRMILVGRPDNSLGYLLHAALPLSAIRDASGSTAIELALQQLEQANAPNSLQQLIQLSIPAQLISRPYYIHRVMLSDAICFPSTAQLHSEADTSTTQPPWQSGRVVLVGDAAHGMPPLMAQGANQGLEDAFVVATLIGQMRKQQNWDDIQEVNRAFEVYEQFRRPLMAHVQKATIERSGLSEAMRRDYEQQVYQRNVDQELGHLKIR